MFRDRPRRLAATCPVHLRHSGGTLQATTLDVAATGIYISTTEPLEEGTEAIAEVALPDRSVVALPVRIAHALGGEEARALGRSAGAGLEIVGALPERWTNFVATLETELAPPQDAPPLSVVVLDRSEPLRRRLQVNLEAAGFAVRGAGDVASALETCRDGVPDILLADAKTQGSNPLVVLKLLAAEAELADIAIVLMAEDAGDQVRLQAYRRGVRDVIPKPFTDEELMIRLRRVGPRAGRITRHVSLRGVLEDVSVPTVLSLLEFEKKPGILVLARESQVGRLFVTDGRVLRAELEGAGGSLPAIDAMLSWKHGSFAFLPGPVSGADEIGMSISSLLLEHARVHDEESDD